jgi:polynucleotide 5'-kinase involved in rRNA processing
MSRRRQLQLALGLSLYLGTVGFLGGMLVERIRFDRERASVLTRFATAEQRLHARLMALEREAEPRGPAR